MGTGFFSSDTGTLNLRVSFTLPNPNLLEWSSWFAWASEMLAEATEGQVRIGAVRYTHLAGADPVMSNTTDLVIAAGSAGETNKFAGLGVAGMHITIGDGQLATPGVLVHELGHYLYGLGDEYIGPDPDNPADPADPDSEGGSIEAFCVDDALPTCTCVMQRGAQSILLLDTGTTWPSATEVVTEFCASQPAGTSATHGALGQTTWQHDRHPGESCWATMAQPADVGTMPALSVPSAIAGPAKPDLAAVPIPVPIQMVPAPAGQRFVLALDRSWSMSTDNKITGVRHAAHTWINIEVLLGNQLGIVSFETAAHTDLMLAPLAAPANAAHAAATAINANGNTNITAALERTATLFAPIPSQHQTVLLFSDGINTVGNDPDQVLFDSLNDSSIDVYTISFGPDADQPLMNTIATATGGQWRHVDVPSDPLNSDFAINFALSYFAAELHSAPIAVARSVLATEPQQRYGKDEPDSEINLDIAAALSSDDIELLPDWFELPVTIEPSATQVTFVLNHREADEVFLYVIKSDGDPLEPAGDGFAQGEGHVAYTVAHSATGVERWLMRARRFEGREDRDAPVGLFTFAENPTLTVAVTGFEPVYSTIDEIAIRVYGLYPGILTGLSVEIFREVGDPDNPTRNAPVPAVESRTGNGEYIAALPTPGGPGTYDYVVRISGGDNTIEAVRRPNDPRDRLSPGPFHRELRRQLRIGPLPEGRDNDGDAGDDHCRICRWLLSLIKWLCRLPERIRTRPRTHSRSVLEPFRPRRSGPLSDP